MKERIQFGAGLSLSAFRKRYGLEAQCLAALEAARWPEGFVCPHCQDFRHSVHSRSDKKVWQCSRCRAQTTVTAGTVFESSKLPLTNWFLGMYLLNQSKNTLSALALSKELHISHASASLMKRKLQQLNDASHGSGASRVAGFSSLNRPPPPPVDMRAGARGNLLKASEALISLWPACNTSDSTGASSDANIGTIGSPSGDGQDH